MLRWTLEAATLGFTVRRACQAVRRQSALSGSPTARGAPRQARRSRRQAIGLTGDTLAQHQHASSPCRVNARGELQSPMHASDSCTLPSVHRRGPLAAGISDAGLRPGPSASSPLERARLGPAAASSLRERALAAAAQHLQVAELPRLAPSGPSARRAGQLQAPSASSDSLRDVCTKRAVSPRARSDMDLGMRAVRSV